MRRRRGGRYRGPDPVHTALAAALLLTVLAPAAVAGAKEEARRILDATGVQGGLVVHLAAGKEPATDLTAALCAGNAYLVHGLYGDAAAVDRARAHLRAGDRYGKVSVDRLAGARLPYADNLVRLIVAEDPGPVPIGEMRRVLCPGGVAYVKAGSGWKTTRKPVPAEIDEWTHALHDPSNNAVSHDTVVAPARHLQWVGGPRWARSHDHLSSCSVAVWSGGRVFAIVDEGPAAAVALPAKWRLVARDAFSGVVLWKRVVDPWEGHLRGFRTGPAAIMRRLVAVGDTVYVTLGYGKPVTALDAATGKTLRTYEKTDDALEILCADGVLYLVLGPALSHGAAQPEHENVGRAEHLSPDDKRLMAVDAETGKVLWTRDDAEVHHVMPTAVAVADGRLYFQNTEHLVCLDAATGQRQWRADRPVTRSRWAWTAPTLVAYGDVVLSADRDAGSKVSDRELGDNQVLWVVWSRGGEAPPGKLIAFAAEDGEKLWESKAREAYNSPVDVLVADGLVWTGILVFRREPGITRGLDPRTGEVKRERPRDQEFFHVGFGHHRCHRNKATDRFLVLGRSGVEWIDLKTGEGVADHWVRGACQYGVMPAGGLLYAPPHSCACYVEAKLNGFLALAPKREGPHAAPAGDGEAGAESEPLEKGPAYGPGIANLEFEISESDWPTYRHDPARTGRASSPIPTALAEGWQRDLGGELTSPVVAGGRVFLAQVQRCTVHALDAETGRPAWSRTVGGRVDAPPTIHKGLCLFGCRDGYVYCLRAADGELVWRFRAAPEDRRVVAYNRLESAWPVQGNVLVHEGSAYFAAGRSSYIDGGMVLYKLDPATGEVRARRRLWDRDPETGREPQKQVRGVSMPGALPDVLSSDGTNLYMRHRRFNADLEPQKPNVPHLFCPAGFLDGSWWHRTYWMYGTRMHAGWGAWARAGLQNPAGRIMVVDDEAVYAFGRLNQYGTAGTHAGLAPKMHPWGSTPNEQPHYVLFASGKEPEVVKEEKGKRRNRRRVKPRWQRPLNVWVRGMVLTEEALFLAGPPDPFDGATTDPEPFAPGKAGLLRVVSPKDGKTLAERALDAPPAWDAMAAARGCLYVATTDGKVTCLKGK